MIKVDDIQSILIPLQEVKFAYLFGSYAKASHTDRSDIDVAVFIDDKYDIFDTKLKVHHQLEIHFNKDIDLVVLNSVKNFDLLEDILNDGILLKDSDDDSRVMYELYKDHEIKDYKAFKRMLDVA